MGSHLTEILQKLTGKNKRRAAGHAAIKDPCNETILWCKAPASQNIADNTEIKIMLEIPRDSRGKGIAKGKAFPGKKAALPEETPVINIEYISEWSGKGNTDAFQKTHFIPGTCARHTDGRDRQRPVIQLPAHKNRPSVHGAGHAHQRQYSDFAVHPFAVIRQFTRALIGKAANFFF